MKQKRFAEGQEAFVLRMTVRTGCLADIGTCLSENCQLLAGRVVSSTSWV